MSPESILSDSHGRNRCALIFPRWMPRVMRWGLLWLLVVGPAAWCEAQPGPVVGWGSYLGGRYAPAPGDEYMTVCAGGYHSLALTAAGRLVAWGENTKGQCNTPTGSGFVAIAAGLYHSLALRADGSLVAWGDNSREQCRAPGGRGFLAIAAGSWHSLGVRSDGSLVAWGWNEQGQCDVPAGNHYTHVAAGHYHSLALTADRAIVAWGGNGDGQCAVPVGNDFIDIAAGSLHSVALRANGTLVAWGRRSERQCAVPPGDDFTAVTAGAFHNLALRRDGSLAAWGPNNYTQCDIPTDGRFALIAAGGYHSLAIRGNRPIPVAFSQARMAPDRQVGNIKTDPAIRPQDLDTGKVQETAGTSGPSAAAPGDKEGAGETPLPIRPSDIESGKAHETAAAPGPSAATLEHKGVAAAMPQTHTALPGEPNTPAGQHEAAQEAQTTSPPAVRAKEATAVEPNHTAERPGAPGKDKSAAAERPPVPAPASPDKVPPVAEPNVRIDATDYLRESIAADSSIGADANAMPVYHFTAREPARHFCTISDEEKYKLIDKQAGVWKYAGIAFFAYPPGKQPRDARAVYRFRSEKLDRYFFTMDEKEKQLLVEKFASAWKYEGVAWYVPPAQPPKPK